MVFHDVTSHVEGAVVKPARPQLPVSWLSSMKVDAKPLRAVARSPQRRSPQ